MTKAHIHGSHPAIIKRLKRAGGHLIGIIAMIEAGRPCSELAQQLHAVEKAILGAKRTLIRDHLDHCLGDGVSALPEERRQALGDLNAITRYL